MNTFTQIARFRQSVVNYSYNFSIKKAVLHFNVSRATIYRWRKKYDGTANSLNDLSRRPHSHPNQHTEDEIKLISDMRRRNPNAGLVVFWVKLRQRGYSRSIPALWRVLRRLALIPVKPPNPKYIPKPYEKMLYPGQRVQIDVKTNLFTSKKGKPTLFQLTLNHLGIKHKLINPFTPRHNGNPSLCAL